MRDKDIMKTLALISLLLAVAVAQNGNGGKCLILHY